MSSNVSNVVMIRVASFVIHLFVFFLLVIQKLFLILYNFYCRTKVPGVVCLITEGTSDDSQRTIEAAKKLHSRGLEVFVVKIGGKVTDELKSIASNPNYVTSDETFDKVQSFHQAFQQVAGQGIAHHLPAN